MISTSTLKSFFYILLIVFIVLTVFVFKKGFIKNKNISADDLNSKVELESEKTQVFKWGVGMNMFALTSDASKGVDWTISKPQFDAAKELGVEYVRVGIPDWAMERQDELILPAVEYANSIGIKIVLGFDPVEGNPVKMAEEKNIYEDGFKWGKEIASRYKGKVNYYQLSNEVTGTAMKDSWSGVSDESYDPAKYQKVIQWLKGASNGVHQSDPGAKRVVTGHWLGFGFFKMAIRDGLDFEVIGWDWYGQNKDLTRIESGDKVYNLIEELSSFNKELWIAEANSPSGSKEGEDYQARYLKEFGTFIKRDARFSGFFPLSLFDNTVPEGEKKSYDGLITIKNKGGIWMIGPKKKSFNEYKELIKRMHE